MENVKVHLMFVATGIVATIFRLCSNGCFLRCKFCLIYVFVALQSAFDCSERSIQRFNLIAENSNKKNKNKNVVVCKEKERSLLSVIIYYLYLIRIKKTDRQKKQLLFVFQMLLFSNKQTYI